MHTLEEAKHIINTVDIKVYYNRFNLLLSEVGSCTRAWEVLESERESVGLPPRYNSFESFKSSKYQYYKRERQKKNIVDPMQIRLF